MTNRFIVGFIICIILTVFAVSSHLAAQNSEDSARINLISADILKYNETINPDYQILSGNVAFEYHGSILYCTTAHVFVHRDFVEAFGDVHIIANDTTHIYGDSLAIDGEKNLAVMSGNVKLIDNSITLVTDRLFYDLTEETAYYNAGAEITDNEKLLISRNGKYFINRSDFLFNDSVYMKTQDTEIFSDSLLYNTKTELAVMFGNSVINGKDYIINTTFGKYDSKNDLGYFGKKTFFTQNSTKLRADSVFYNNKDGFGNAYRNIQIEDSVENIIVNSNFATFFNQDSSFIAADSALLRVIDKNDTIYLHADTLRMYNDSLIHHQKLILAYHAARMYSEDMQTVCDSLVYLRNDSLIYLFRNPVLWLDSTQMLSDSVRIEFKNKELKNVYLDKNAFIISKEESGDYQQIKSERMVGFFSDSKLNSLWAYVNVETVYYVMDEKMKLIGINLAKAEKVLLSFLENRVEKIVFVGSPKGTMNPEDNMNDESKKLSSFKWEQDSRPKYPQDVFRDVIKEPVAKPLTDNLKTISDTLISNDKVFDEKGNITKTDSLISTDEKKNNLKERGTGKTVPPQIQNTENSKILIFKRLWYKIIKLFKRKQRNNI